MKKKKQSSHVAILAQVNFDVVEKRCAEGRLPSRADDRMACSLVFGSRTPSLFNAPNPGRNGRVAGRPSRRVMALLPSELA